MYSIIALCVFGPLSIAIFYSTWAWLFSFSNKFSVSLKWVGRRDEPFSLLRGHLRAATHRHHYITDGYTQVSLAEPPKQITSISQ
jgi:hypothetical protein